MLNMLGLIVRIKSQQVEDKDSTWEDKDFIWNQFPHLIPLDNNELQVELE